MSVTVAIKDRLGDFALDVAFEAPQGITVLFGKSGSGKTSVINAISGLTQPKSGLIKIEDTVLFDSDAGLNLPVHKRQLGYVFQDARLFPHMTVAKNLAYGTRFATSLDALLPRDRVIDMLGIGALLDRRPAALSGGEKQRVAIGRALLSNPRLILADEPLAALDEERKTEILPYFERLRDELSIPIIYVSHSAAEVARLATTIVVMDRGSVVRTGSASDVLSDPRVTPLGAGAAGAVLTAQVVRHHDDGLTELIAGGVTLLLPRCACEPGKSVRVHVEAQDVMIARKKPEAISALNVMPATVRDIRMGDGPGALVQLESGENRLLARVTRRSVEALDLSQGAEVYAVLKAVSVARDHVGDRS